MVRDDDEKRRALSYHHDGSNSGGRTMRLTQARTKDRANCLSPKS